MAAARIRKYCELAGLCFCILVVVSGSALSAIGAWSIIADLIGGYAGRGFGIGVALAFVLSVSSVAGILWAVALASYVPEAIRETWG